MILIFLLVIGLSAVSAANTCRTGTVVHRPNNNQTYSFPIGWDESQSAPPLTADQSCSWVITIPQGYYAKIIIAGDIDVGQFQLVDVNGNVFISTHENKEPYYFPAPKFTLMMVSETAATLGFKIVWAKYPSTIPNQIGYDETPAILNISSSEGFAVKIVVDASFFIFPADPNNYYSLRSVMVFVWDSNGTYVSSLWQTYNSNAQWFSDGYELYVVNVEPNGAFDQLLVQYSRLTSLSPYHELNCAKSSTCTKSLDGGQSPSGLVYIGNQKQVLTGISMDDTATLSVYFGAITDSSLYKSYSGSVIQTLLPLPFTGKSPRQFVISSGKSTMTFDFSD